MNSFHQGRILCLLLTYKLTGMHNAPYVAIEASLQTIENQFYLA